MTEAEYYSKAAEIENLCKDITPKYLRRFIYGQLKIAYFKHLQLKRTPTTKHLLLIDSDRYEGCAELIPNEYSKHSIADIYLVKDVDDERINDLSQGYTIIGYLEE